MRKFTVPTTFTADFLEKISALNHEFAAGDGQVSELYGSFQGGAFHSARPAKYLPAISRDQFSAHVRAARKRGIRFNYLLNAPAYANLEYRHKGRTQLEELLRFLVDSGTAAITVAVPFLAEIISSRYPQLEVVISTIGYVNSFAGLTQYRQAGARRIVLDVEVNRDFRFIEASAASEIAELEVIVNPVCISQCHFKYNHYCVASTGAQSYLHGGSGAPYNSYYLNWCFLEKLENPAEFLKSPWIRPEDLHLWEERGIESFKIAGRGLDEDRIVQLCRSYLERRFSGNLLGLLGWPHWLAFRETAKGTRLAPLEIFLDNELLEGFLPFFATARPQCRYGCASCGHCLRWTDKALRFNDRDLLEHYRENMRRNLRQLIETIPTREQDEAAARQWHRQALEQEVKK